MWKDGTNNKYGMGFLMVSGKQSSKLGQDGSVDQVCLLHTDPGMTFLLFGLNSPCGMELDNCMDIFDILVLDDCMFCFYVLDYL